MSVALMAGSTTALDMRALVALLGDAAWRSAALLTPTTTAGAAPDAPAGLWLCAAVNTWLLLGAREPLARARLETAG